MKGEQYLSKPWQYGLVHSRGRSYPGNMVVLRVLPNGLELSRYGFVVSRRVGKAVVRNKVKRLFREILRQAPLKPGRDIVIIARPRAAGAGFADLEKLILSLLSRAQLLMENYEESCIRTN
ncbi:MAG: ribonuclease P protein component [Dehalococcoidales bacterium]|nr:ribonuclease P protein component [Dehalococcoidales bacterium]